MEPGVIKKEYLLITGFAGPVTLHTHTHPHTTFKLYIALGAQYSPAEY